MCFYFFLLVIPYSQNCTHSLNLISIINIKDVTFDIFNFQRNLETKAKKNMYLCEECNFNIVKFMI